MNTEPLHIPDGYDMNDGVPPAAPPPPVSEFAPFPDDIFENLPPHLALACRQFARQEEKELFLVGALGVISGMLPHVQGMYFGRMVGANLYCFIMGRYGTGKGALLWARDLGEAVEAHREAQAKEGFAKHTEEMLHYHRQLKLYDKGKLPAPPEMPKPPRHLKLYLPANSTKTAVMQLLMENDGRGIMFETEGDTLADMLRQDYGNFSDVLRKAFHHEPVSYYRRANNEDVKINYPALSVVLSGTQDQLHKLIPAAENGLFSRFCFYVLQSSAPFYNPFDESKTEHSYYFGVLAAHFLALYMRLEARTEPVLFALRPEQQAAFVTQFDKYKTELRHLGDDLDGTANRLGLICYRIAMVLTAVRFGGSVQLDTLTCITADFENACLIVEQLLKHSLYVYEGLESKKALVPKSVSATMLTRNAEKEERIKETCMCYNAGMVYEDIALRVLGKATGVSTVYRWVRDFCKKRA